MTEAYPLQWPQGKPRTTNPKKSAFDTSQQKSQMGLMRELKLLGASNIVLSSNMVLRNDGLPYANQSQPSDTGVAVYFTYKENQVCFCCDRWDKVKDNVQAVMHTISALRGISRWGTGDMVAAAFSGFMALPPPAGKHWTMVLDIGSSLPIEEIEAQYKTLARKHHPDNGGDAETMAKINIAIEQARREKLAA